MLTPNLLPLVKYYEGLRLTPYKDGNGYWTVGYGHLLSLDKTLPKPPRIDQEKATAYLATDLAKTAQLVSGVVLARLNANQFSSLVDFTFNLGIGRLKQSTLLRKINREDNEDEILREFPKWRQPGSVNELGLARRRGSEIELWLTGGFTPADAIDYYKLYRS